jgi:predicted PurR-regulated permease PerM
MPAQHRSTVLFAFAVALALWLAYLVRNTLFIIYIAALFSVVISPAVELVRRARIGRWRPGRGTAVLVILLAGLGLMAVFFAFALPPIFRDIQGLAQDWPRRAAQLSEHVKRVPFAGRFDPSSLQQYLSGAVGGVLGLFKGIAGGVFGFFSFVILTAYFILDGRRAFDWLMSLVPLAQRSRLRGTFIRGERRMRRWLVGQGALMLILGVSATAVFGLLGIKYSYALGVFAGLANIVPIVGPLISVILAGIVAAVDSGTKLLGVLVFYFVYQQVENAFLTPRIISTAVDLPPLAVIIALALGGSLGGILGALVAVPTAALVAVLVDEYLVQPDTPEEAETARAVHSQKN